MPSAPVHLAGWRAPTADVRPVRLCPLLVAIPPVRSLGVDTGAIPLVGYDLRPPLGPKGPGLSDRSMPDRPVGSAHEGPEFVRKHPALQAAQHGSITIAARVARGCRPEFLRVLLACGGGTG